MLLPAEKERLAMEMSQMFTNPSLSPVAKVLCSLWKEMEFTR